LRKAKKYWTAAFSYLELLVELVLLGSLTPFIENQSYLAVQEIIAGKREQARK